MAPGTNLGAATPVQLGGLPGQDGKDPGTEKREGKGEGGSSDESATAPASAMSQKLVNDAVAYLRSLAQLRGRNAEWAEKAVTEAATLTAAEALESNVIEIIAEDRQDLLGHRSGRMISEQIS